MSRDLPILYSASMVLACLAGLKTQTRRLPPRELWHDVEAMLAWGRKRFGDPGDVLYAREAHALETCGDDGARLVYRADRAARWCGVEVGEIFYLESNYQPAARWRPGIHLHKWASRIRRRRTEPLRIERLQDISDDDIRAEGFVCPQHNLSPVTVKPFSDMNSTATAQEIVRRFGEGGGIIVPRDDIQIEVITPRCHGCPWLRDGFSTGWDEINGDRGTWAENPPVVVISFDREEVRAA